jgi:hypothetical protein
MPPKAVSYLFEGAGAGFPIKFPHSSHQYPIKIVLFSSSSKNSNQIPLVPCNNPSKSFCSQKVPIKFFLFPSIMEDRQVSTKVNGETSERLGQSAKRSATSRGQAGRGATWEADVCRVRQSRKSGISAWQFLWKICFSRGSLPRCFLYVRDPSMVSVGGSAVHGSRRA